MVHARVLRLLYEIQAERSISIGREVAPYFLERGPLGCSYKLWIVVSHRACLQKPHPVHRRFYSVPPTKVWLATACATAWTIPSWFISKLVAILWGARPVRSE